jgi:hypothetical protein
MKYVKFLWPLALLVWSCSSTEPVIAKCDMVDMVKEGERVMLTIHSTSDFVDICPTWGECFRCNRHYFNCITFPAVVGEVFEVIDQERVCYIEI